MSKQKRERLEKRLGLRLVRQWILDGAGPARFGWGSLHACKVRWEGRTLDEIEQRVGAPDARGAADGEDERDPREDDREEHEL